MRVDPSARSSARHASLVSMGVGRPDDAAGPGRFAGLADFAGGRVLSLSSGTGDGAATGPGPPCAALAATIKPATATTNAAPLATNAVITQGSPGGRNPRRRGGGVGGD